MAPVVVRPPPTRPLLFPVALLRAELEALQGSSGRSRFDDGGWEAAAAGGGSGSGGADARSQAAWLMGTPSTKGARLAAAAQGDDARRANERRQSVLRRHQIDAEAHAAHVAREADARVADADARVAKFDAAERGLDELADALDGADGVNEYVTVVKLMNHMRSRKKQ